MGQVVFLRPMSPAFPPFPIADFPAAGGMNHPRPANPLPKLMNLNPGVVQRAPHPILPSLPLFGHTPVSSRVMPTLPNAPASPTRPQTVGASRTEEADYTDEDLAAALMPMVELSLHQTLLQPGSLIDIHWEPWLRTTLRRALAEQKSLGDHVEQPGWFDHLLCRVNANWSGRSVDDVLSEKFRHFRVEQVYLLARDRGEMIAHAAIDARLHTHHKQVIAMARHLVESMHDAEGTIRLQFRLPRGRRAELRVGRHSYLIAVVVGEFPEILRTDLDFILRRIEERYGKRFADHDALLASQLKTYLLDCLLLSNPALDP